MSKSVVIKLAIVSVVSVFVYSAFWFFKIGQFEKQVNNFVSDNSSHISVGEVSVSGFPLSQKITVKDVKFTIPNSAFSKHQILIKTLEAKAGVFSSDFNISLTEGVSLQDQDGKLSSVEFSKDPEIHISISDNKITNLSYQDFGYRVLDSEKNIVYASSGSAVKVESTSGENDKIVTKIVADIKDMENFDVTDVYKNSFEKGIIESIKTNEITLGNGSPVVTTDSSVLAAQPTTQTVADPDKNKTSESAAMVAPGESQSSTSSDTPSSPTSKEIATSPDKSKELELDAVIASSNLVKSNLLIDIEHIQMPIQNEESEKALVNPAEIREPVISSAQYSKIIKINNLELSNMTYKISVNGEVNIFQDDSLPSGSISIKVEKIDPLIDFISTGLVKIIDQQKGGGLSGSTTSTDIMGKATPSYSDFLTRINTGFVQITKEIATKNPASKEDVAVFDIRRERNLDFLVNETSMREILGKF